MGAPTKEQVTRDKDGIKMHEGWNTCKVIEVKAVKDSIIIEIENDDKEKEAIWLKDYDNLTGYKRESAAKLWYGLSIVFGFDLPEEPGVPVISLVDEIREKMLGNYFDVHIKHNSGNDGKIYVNFVDFNEAGQVEDSEK